MRCPHCSSLLTAPNQLLRSQPIRDVLASIGVKNGDNVETEETRQQACAARARGC